MADEEFMVLQGIVLFRPGSQHRLRRLYGTGVFQKDVARKNLVVLLAEKLLINSLCQSIQQ